MSKCKYHDNKICFTCNLIDKTEKEQIAEKIKLCATYLSHIPADRFLKPIYGNRFYFRNKAKMVVSGSVNRPTLGILKEDNTGIDLSQCPLYNANITKIMPLLKKIIIKYGLTPYNINTRQGELKHIIVGYAETSGEMLVRFVLRSKKFLKKLERAIKYIQVQNKLIKVISVNIKQEHEAIIEGAEEIVLTKKHFIKEKGKNIFLYRHPKSFFQTNTKIAFKLYETAAQWASELKVDYMWDLFCGIGGFSFHLAQTVGRIRGIDISKEAIESAKKSKYEQTIGNIFFDIMNLSTLQDSIEKNLQLILVNPPKRGLGESLCNKIEESNVKFLLYSSCNIETLSEDLRLLKSFAVKKLQIFDMFPNSIHFELLVLLGRED